MTGRRIASRSVGRAAAVIALVLAAGCGTEDFPGSPQLAGARDVPYVTTYNFGFPVRFDRITGADGNLLIISGGDLLNLISAANITQVVGNGVVSGTVRDTAGTTVADVVLAATDADGNKIGDFFYNGLGGTPDFVQTRGTVPTGGFTIFNAKPGEVFLKAVSGGRGGTRLAAFPDQVSLGLVTIRPAVVPVVGVTGEINDALGRPLLAGNVTIQIMGQKLSQAGDCTDETPSQDAVEAARFPTLTAFRFCVASEGDYVVRLSGDRNLFVPTYYPLQTDRARLVTQQATDVTAFFSIQTRRELDLAVERGGVPWREETTGIIAGQITAGNGAPQRKATIRVTNAAGEEIALPNVASPGKGTIWYLDSNGVPIEGANVTGQSGYFLIINLPVLDNGAGTAYVSVTSEQATTGKPERYVGTVSLPVIVGSVVYQPIEVALVPPIVSGDDTSDRYFTGPLSGRVMTEDGLYPVAGARITPLGVPLVETPQQIPQVFDADGNGDYAIPPSEDPRAKAPLLAGSRYVLKVEGPPGDETSFVPTYQLATAGTTVADASRQVQAAVRNLTAVSEAAINDALAGVAVTRDRTLGILYGTVLDRSTGRPADGISLRIQPLHGGPDIPALYYDFTGVMRSPEELKVTTNDGRFVAFNVPPGRMSIDVVSPDDTGNVLVDAFAGGVTVLRMAVNNAPPEVVDVSGRVTDLHGVGVEGVTLSVVGGDPLPRKTRCPDGPNGVPLTEREGLCYADPTERVNGVEKVPIPCNQAYPAYLSYKSHSAERDGYCAAVGASDATGGFSLALGSYADQVIKSSGPGLIDTYTFGVTTGQQPLTGVPAVAIKRDEIDRLAAAAGLTREAGSGLIWGQTTTASLGTVDEQGLLTPLDCSGWEVPDGASACGGLGVPGALATGSFNTDGLRDLAVIDATPSTPGVTIWLSTGDGSFVRSQRIGSLGANGPCAVGEIGCGVENDPVALLVLDVDADGLSDLVVLNAGSRSISMLKGRGRGKFAFGGTLTVSPEGSLPSAMATADFNRDRIADLLITDRPTGRITLLLGTGSGFRSFYPPLSQDRVGDEPRAVASGQLDFDGIPDLVFATRDGIVVMQGIGVTNSLTRYPVPVGTAPDLGAVAIGDVNQDGFSDVLVADRAPGTPRIWVFLNSFVGLQTPTSIPAGALPSALALVDVDGDRLLDLIVINQGDGTVLYRPGLGDGNLGEPQVFSIGGRPGALAVDDVTGDGLVDAVLSDPGSNRVLILPRSTRPAAGIAVAAVREDGGQVGTVVYLADSPGGFAPAAGASSTGPSGRFMILNVPPGPVWLQLLSGGTGNRFLQAYPDGATNTTFQIIVGPTKTVPVDGVTVDAVLRPVGEVQIHFLGTEQRTASNPVTFDDGGNPSGGANYRTSVDANSDYVIKLSK